MNRKYIMDQKDPRLREIWKQEKIPVVFREGKSKPLLIRLPYAPNNKQLLKANHRNDPEWVKQYQCWRTPASWFEDIVKRALIKYGQVYVIQPFQEKQKCSPACWNARGIQCECSCMGEHHGAGNPVGKWHIVSETFAVSWGDKTYSCRLIVPSE